MPNVSLLPSFIKRRWDGIEAEMLDNLKQHTPAQLLAGGIRCRDVLTGSCFYFSFMNGAYVCVRK